MSWWTRDPERFERELDDLRTAAYDPQPREVAGRMRIGVTVPVNGMNQPMEIRYPDLFPLFRFHVYAPVSLFKRHQEPFTGALCVLGPGTGAWDQDDTAAAILASQIALIEEVNRSEAPRPDLETDQIEPVSRYVPTTPGAVFVLPREAYLIDRRQRNGSLTVALSSELSRPPRGYVTHVGSRTGTLPDLCGAFPNTSTREVLWSRIDKLPELSDLATFGAALVAAGAVPQARPTDRPLSIYGIAFDEEVAYGQPLGTGWLFMFRINEQGRRYRSGLIRAERYEPADQAARLRDITGLDRKRVVIFGTGALGAPIAHLLMQARVGHLRLVDFDVVTLGIAVRWPLGFQLVGLAKTDALYAFGKGNYPETEIERIHWHIGVSHNETDPDEHALLERTLAGVDLVIDATAELDVQHFLAYEARARRIPLISVEAREGAYGGRVARFRPGGACRTCLKYHQMDGRLRLPAHEQGTVLPAGCASATFTGASFDLVSLSALAARLTAQTLVANDRYRDAAWDVASLWNRTSDAGEIGETPRWEFDTLEVHPSCPEH